MTAELVGERGGASGGLVLATRHPEVVSGLVPGAEARLADFNDPETLRAAFAGVTRLLIISTDTVGTRSAQHVAAIDAAREVGVEHVIYTSMLSPAPPNPALIADSHWATEECLRASGLDYTILRFSLYSDFQVFEAADALASGRFVHNRGAGGCSYIARSDCALVSAVVATGDGHQGMTYELTGPESLDATRLAALYSEVGGRTVEAVPVGDDELLHLLDADAGTDGHVQYGAALAVSLGRAIREDNFSAVTTTVKDLTATAPRTVHSQLAESAERLRLVASTS